MTEIWSREVRTQLTERLGIFQLWTHSAQIKSYCKTTCSCFLRLVILGLYLQVAFSVGYSVLISKFLLRMDIHSVNAVEIYVHAWTPGTGDCWVIEYALLLNWAVSNHPGYFPRRLLWVVFLHGVYGRSRCPSSSCDRCSRSQGGSESPAQLCISVLGCVLHSWVLGQNVERSTSPTVGTNSHKFSLMPDFKFAYAAICSGHLLSSITSFSDRCSKTTQ